MAISKVERIFEELENQKKILQSMKDFLMILSQLSQNFIIIVKIKDCILI
jgi:hypothetical protein